MPGENSGAATLPKVTFSTFVMSLASSALVHLGEVPNPETGKTERNDELARHTIDVLSMIDEKISHGLSAEESGLMRDILYELRMKFIAHS